MGHFEFLLHFNPGTARTPAEKREALKKACNEFESLFWEQLLKTMRKTIPKSHLLGEGREEEFYTSLYDEELSVQLGQRGGLGISESLYRELCRKWDLGPDAASPNHADTGRKVPRTR